MHRDKGLSASVCSDCSRRETIRQSAEGATSASENELNLDVCGKINLSKSLEGCAEHCL